VQDRARGRFASDEASAKGASVKRVSPGEFFETIARRYDRAYALGPTATRERMAGVLGALPAAPARVLDLGVGTGRELGALQDAGYAPTGLDASPSMLAICARRARPVPLVQADLWTALPFDDASFDAAIALHGTLAHPPAREAYVPFAREIARVVRAGGTFVAEVPSRAWLARFTVLEEGDARIVRTGDDRCVHEDRAAGIAVEAIVPSDDEWRAAFAPWFDVTCEALGASETRVVAKRR
jgi:SAM-dependent methyltransferase